MTASPLPGGPGGGRKGHAGPGGGVQVVFRWCSGGVQAAGGPQHVRSQNCCLLQLLMKCCYVLNVIYFFYIM